MYFENVDFSDGGVASVQLRVKSQSATTLELRADSQTGALLGTCTVPSTSNAWATQTCTLDQTATGVARLYLVFGGAMHLNWLKFLAGTVSNRHGRRRRRGRAAAGGSAAGGRGGNAAGGVGGSANGGAAGGTNGGAAGGTNGGTVVIRMAAGPAA